MKAHTFHVPVMGIGYTIDTPLKIAQYGIDSVISLIDDMLLERLRSMHSRENDIPYQEITAQSADHRAERITAYLNLINRLVEQKFEDMKKAAVETGKELKAFFGMLPERSKLGEEFRELVQKQPGVSALKNWLDNNLSIGSIDVNIMTKVDKDNYKKGVKLPVEYNDAHAALRGYAKSELRSSIVLSAGLNPRLYSYMEQFEDFYPDENGSIKKKIVLKVSDFKSAIIQGKFLAKKGLWVSEYRVESGLNCGGHAFATDGLLMGPILAGFRDKRESLINEIHALLVQTLSNKSRSVPSLPLPVRFTTQGGVGTAGEHQFLIDHYKLDSVGWGSPFLLVPEATSVDDTTRNQLMDATENQLYLSNISPLGIPFNSMRGNTKDIEKLSITATGKPGSACPKNYAALNNEYPGKSLCISSRQFQRLKISELDNEGLSAGEYQTKYNRIVEKACICVGLGTSALLANNLDTRVEGVGVSVCPGPNIAYFSKTMSLQQMTGHIYGREDMISRTDRPHMFVQELNIYLTFFKNLVEEENSGMSLKKEKYLMAFEQNLNDGIDYYSALFSEVKNGFGETAYALLKQMEAGRKTLQSLSPFGQFNIENRVPVSLHQPLVFG